MVIMKLCQDVTGAKTLCR